MSGQGGMIGMAPLLTPSMEMSSGRKWSSQIKCHFVESCLSVSLSATNHTWTKTSMLRFGLLSSFTLDIYFYSSSFVLFVSKAKVCKASLVEKKPSTINTSLFFYCLQPQKSDAYEVMKNPTFASLI